MELVNPNNCRKGAWVLHMLRGVLGDSVFFEGILGDRHETRGVRVFERDQLFRIALPRVPRNIEIDPDRWVLKSVSVQNP